MKSREVVAYSQDSVRGKVYLQICEMYVFALVFGGCSSFEWVDLSIIS